MTDTVKNTLDKYIDNMFTELVEEYDLKSGDFAPEQAYRLDNIKDELGDLLGDFVFQNLRVEE